MKYLNIALAQIDPCVGALARNADLIVERACAAAAAGAQIVVFPELSLSGYPPEDLILKHRFIEDCRHELNRILPDLPADRLVIVGMPGGVRGKAFNAAVLCMGGQIQGIYRKILLPNYGVFDEKRLFLPGHKTLVAEYGPARIGIHICEDSWFTDALPCQALQPLELDALINLSASPFQRAKLHQREEVLVGTARYLSCSFLYCNLVGGQDELVFDGASMGISPSGNVIARARQFAEDSLSIRIPLPVRSGPRPPIPTDQIDLCRLAPVSTHPRGDEPGHLARIEEPLDELAEVYEALKLGLSDYMRKNGFARTVVALSGGIDSAIVAAIAVDALGPERVVGVTMPSRFSSTGTRADALKLANNLDIEFLEIPIQGLQDAYLAQLTDLWKNLKPDAAEENLQARIRGNLVMALSNKFGWLVLTTGNKSELATGYCTLYGDMAGGFAVIKDVPKTLVFDLARWRNRQAGGAVIPPSTIERPPSAELRPNQRDTDSLPPYDLLDAILERYVERDLGAPDIISEGFDPDVVRRVIRLVDTSEYKRRQGAPGIKITPKAFGRDRRMPITNQYR